MVFDNSSHHQIFSPSSHKLRFAVKPPAPPLGPTAILFNLSKKKGHGLGIPFLKLFTTFLFYIRCLGTVPNFETRWLHQGAWFFNGISLIFSGRCPLSLQGFKASHWYDHLPSHHRFHQWEFFQHDTNVTGRHVCSIKFGMRTSSVWRSPDMSVFVPPAIWQRKLFCKESKLAMEQFKHI